MPNEKELEELGKEIEELESGGTAEDADVGTRSSDLEETEAEDADVGTRSSGLEEAEDEVEVKPDDEDLVTASQDDDGTDVVSADEADDSEVIAVAVKMKDEDGDVESGGRSSEDEVEAKSDDEELEATSEDDAEEVDLGSRSSELEETEDETTEDVEGEEVSREEDRDKQLALEKAVDEIVHHEGDENLDAEDAKMMAAFSPAASKWGRLKEWFARPRNRYSVIGVLTALVVLILVVPLTRYAVFNSIGVRGSLAVTVLDADSGLPLKNVAVKLGGQSAETDRSGQAIVTGVKLGGQELVIEKLAYASHSSSITVGTGTNEVEAVSLKPTGTQYSFRLSDWLSDTAIEGAEVSYGENSVLSDVGGQALLTIPPLSDKTIDVLITAEGYRPATLTVVTTETELQALKLVVDEQHFFVSKRTGAYNVYKVDLDGTNEELVLEGTGKENDSLQLLSMTNKRAVFLVSSREGKHNSDGSILYGLFQIDSETGDFEKIDESESIRLYGTSRNHLIYVKVKAGASAGNPNRQRLVSYDPVSGRSIEIASTNYFNSVNVTDSAIFYAPSDLYKTEKAPYLYRVNPTTGEKTTVHAAEVWSIFRTGYGQLTFDAKQDWYQVGTANGSRPIPLDARPANISSKIFQVSPDGQSAAYIDYRDGKGYLIVVDTETSDEETVHVQSGMKHPLVWASPSHIIFRVASDEGSSDYIVDLRGGDAVELTEVSDIASYDRWYYYY